MEKSRQSWSKPELVVFARTHSEESLVSFCKQIVGGGGMSAVNSGCFYNACAQCSGTMSS